MNVVRVAVRIDVQHPGASNLDLLGVIVVIQVHELEEVPQQEAGAKPEELCLLVDVGNHRGLIHDVHGVRGLVVHRQLRVELEGLGPIFLIVAVLYNEESFFVRHAYFLGANDPYKSLKTTLKSVIDEDAWAPLNSDTSRPFAKPKSGRIAVKVINHLGDEVMKVFKVE